MKIIGSDKGIHSPEFHKKKLRQRRIRIAITIAILALVIGVPIYLARMHSSLIRNINISGATVTKADEIRATIQSDIAGDYIFIFPRSNAILYPHNKIVDDLMREYPRLASVDLSLQNPSTLSVSVSERTPAAIYCQDTSNLSSPRGCYFIDTTGYIFSPAPDFSGDVYLIFTKNPVIDAPLGAELMPADKFHNLPDFVKALGNIGIFPRIFEISSDQYDVVMPNGAKIIWNPNDDLDTILLNLDTLFSDSKIQADKSFLNRILYIDLRFQNKIFYKFRDGS